VISAVEALDLPTATPTEDEIAAANMLEAEIEAHVRKSMALRGVEYKTNVTNPNVISIVNQRLKRAGWVPQWQMLVEQSKFVKEPRIIGFGLNMAPNDEAFALHYKLHTQ
jgi:hypothetical protein